MLAGEAVRVLKWLGILCVVSLLGCTQYVSIIKPLDVSRANQTASAAFVVDKKGIYMFALLFVRHIGEGGGSVPLLR